MNTPVHRSNLHARPGTVYLLVLVTVMLVAVLLVSGMFLAGVQRATAEAELDSISARAQAESGIEVGVHLATNSAAWRQSVSLSPVVAATAMADGSFATYAADPVDGDLGDDLNDPVILQSLGFRNNARQIVRVMLDPDWTPLTCLNYAMCAGGAISINSADLRCIGAIAANGAVTASSAYVTPDVYALGGATGSAYAGSRSTPAAAFTLPTTPWTAYSTWGTMIPINGISGRRIDRQLLSPGRNPYGATNAAGVYIVSCGGNDLRIRDSRIVGTLIVLNCGGLTLEKSVFMEPAVPGWPTLIVDGDLTFSTEAVDLSESTSMNMNPASTPYKGQSDSDTTDTYPSVLVGIVYSAGSVVVSGPAAVEGTLVARNSISVNAALTLYSRPVTKAPPGFVAGNGFSIRPGSWARVVE